VTEVVVRSTESTDSDEDDLAARFMAAVASLSEGELTFPSPFNLATSAALAANLDVGAIAERLFEVTALRDTGYRVAIYATAPGVADREVIDTDVRSTRLLISLLDGLIDEQCARLEKS
jgi:hypothetical protein